MNDFFQQTVRVVDPLRRTNHRFCALLLLSFRRMLIGLTLLGPVTTSTALALDFGAGTNVSRFGAYPCWSPDSRRLAFTDTNSPGIWVYHRDTGQTRQIHAPGGFPTWHPRNETIAFRKRNELWLIRSDGTGATNTGVAIGSGLRWSPNGRYLLTYESQYAPHDQIFVIQTDSWSKTELPFVRVGTRQKVGYSSWTPENNLMITPPVGESGDWQSNEIREYALDGTLIGKTILVGFISKAFDARVSPDGRLIVFHRGSRGIWVGNRDGSGVRQISRAGSAAEWSPDQTALAYDDSSSMPYTRNGIFIMEVDSSRK